jgi:hypothetical protein
LVKIRKVSATLIDEPKQATTRAVNPAQLDRKKREDQFRQLISGLSSPDDVSLVAPSGGEKLATIRAGLRKVAQEMGKERDIIVRKYEDGFLVALSTPEREATRRGRRPKAGS